MSIPIPRSVKTRKEMLAKAEARVEVLRDCLEDAEEELLRLQQALAADALGKNQDCLIEVGDWECEQSPIGVCAYDPDEDPCRDDCLFCHDPHERK